MRPFTLPAARLSCSWMAHRTAHSILHASQAWYASDWPAVSLLSDSFIDLFIYFTCLLGAQDGGMDPAWKAATWRREPLCSKTSTPCFPTRSTAFRPSLICSNDLGALWLSGVPLACLFASLRLVVEMTNCCCICLFVLLLTDSPTASHWARWMDSRRGSFATRRRTETGRQEYVARIALHALHHPHRT